MEAKRKINWIARAAVALLILVLLSAHFSGGMLARYRSGGSGSDSARVAVFEVTEAGELFVKGFSLSMDPSDGEMLCAEMQVYNVSETAIRCTVEVGSTENLPLDFYIKDESGAVVEGVDIAPNSGSEPVTIRLYAHWRDGDDSYLYHREVDHVTVTLISTQID